MRVYTVYQIIDDERDYAKKLKHDRDFYSEKDAEDWISHKTPSKTHELRFTIIKNFIP